jgi:hypothetical protein
MAADPTAASCSEWHRVYDLLAKVKVVDSGKNPKQWVSKVLS